MGVGLAVAGRLFMIFAEIFGRIFGILEFLQNRAE